LIPVVEDGAIFPLATIQHPQVSKFLVTLPHHCLSLVSSKHMDKQPSLAFSVPKNDVLNFAVGVLFIRGGASSTSIFVA
jgi:hypothetical protein